MIHKTARRLGAVCAALCLLPLAAHAQFNPQYYISLSNDMLTTLRFNTVAQMHVNNVNNIVAQERWMVERNKASTAFSVDRASSGAGIGKLVAAYPPASRAQVKKTFAELLSGYHQLEEKFDLPRNDVAGAVAAFIAGNYMAYRDVDLPDEQFGKLASQMHEVLVNEPEFAKASNAQKQETYEQLAIIGTMMATLQEGLKQQPNEQLAAAMRKAAKGYLEEFLKVDAAKVSLTAQGLVIR